MESSPSSPYRRSLPVPPLDGVVAFPGENPVVAAQAPNFRGGRVVEHEVPVFRSLPGAAPQLQPVVLGGGHRGGIPVGQSEVVRGEVVFAHAEQSEGGRYCVIALPDSELDGHARVVGQVVKGQIAIRERLAHQAQIDGVAADHEVRNRVVPVAFGEQERVLAVTARKRVGTGTADDGVVALAAGDRVVAGVTEEQVVALAAVDAVVTAVAPDPVAAFTADDGVVAASAPEDVVAATTVDRVVAGASQEDVEAPAALDRVVASGPVEQVEVLSTRQEVVRVSHRSVPLCPGPSASHGA